MNPPPVYLDHAATTAVRPEAADAMLPWLTGRVGNPSGAHAAARAARQAVDEARDIVAGHLGIDAGGVVFTGGGSEADNLAILGVTARREGVVVTTAGEHHAVLHAAAAAGREVRTVGLTADGTVDLDGLAAALDRHVAVVSVMAVNNEVGTVNPLEAVSDLVRRRARRAVLHVDAVQSVPWLDLGRTMAAADLLSLSAHKFGGPQGVGLLAVADGIAVAPIIHGGGQERDRRSGTHNVAGIAGLAAALHAACSGRDREVPAVAALRDRLLDGLARAVPGLVETTSRRSDLKVAGNAHVRFPGVEAEALLILLDDGGVCASAGSSCSSGAVEPSHVLVAMGLEPTEAASSVRFSLGWTTTADDIDGAVDVVADSVARLSAAPVP